METIDILMVVGYLLGAWTTAFVVSLSAPGFDWSDEDRLLMSAVAGIVWPFLVVAGVAVAVIFTPAWLGTYLRRKSDGPRNRQENT